MTKKIIKLLEQNGIKILATILPEYWEECDDSIQLDKNYHLQIGDNYICLCEEVENGIKYIKEIELNDFDNTKKINDFIDIIKQLN